MTRKFSVSLLLAAAIFSASTTVFAVELKKNERLFTEEYGRVFDATVAVITETGFAVHPHKKMKTKKAKGRIKTPEWRYFKIWSAKPVVEKQYKDSYKIKVKEIEIEVPQPAVEKKEGEVAATDAAPTDAAPAAAPDTEAATPPEGAPADGAVAADAAPAPAPIPTVKKVKVSIKRKFLVHNDATRKWDKGDPNKENAGYSIEYLFKAIQEKLDKEPSPTADATKQANLNITPPPIDRVVRP